MGAIGRKGPRTSCATAPALSVQHAALLRQRRKALETQRIITVLQAITLPINHRGTLHFSSSGPPTQQVRAAIKCEEEDPNSCKFYSVGLLLW